MRISLKDIISAEPKKAVEVAKSLFANRRTAEHKANTGFYSGNHWQKGEGWIGEKPSVMLEGFASAAIGLEKIRLGFVSENVIAEADDRHVAGILGREVNFDFVPEALFRLRRKKVPDLPEKGSVAEQADEDLTSWWNEDRPKDKLKEALLIALNEERASLRFIIPRGLRDEKGEIPIQPTIPDALNFLFVDVVPSDKCGVFVDPETQRKFSVYFYESNSSASQTSDLNDGYRYNGEESSFPQNSKSSVLEISWVENGLTNLQIISDDPNLAQERFTCDLGGRLWMYELRRKPLITEQVRSIQRALNLALTMEMRNVNMAGSRERYFLNVQRPTETVQVRDATESSGYREETRPLPGLPVGAGASPFLNGVLIKNEKGETIDRADPNVSITEPVDVTTFVQTHDQYYAAILSQCQQIHVLISKDATASGRSREQARAEFESSLRLSKEVVDDAGRWMLETALRLASHLCNQTATYAGLRCDFNAIIQTGQISPEERTANRDDVKAGLLSKETSMSRAGVEDTNAEKKLIAGDKAETPPLLVPPPENPPNGDSQLLQ